MTLIKAYFSNQLSKNSEKSLVYYLCTICVLVFWGSYVIFTLNLHHQHKILQTMKKLFLLIFLLIGLAETQAQSFTYHPLKGFHGDTISFLKSNFYDQRNYFVGKKFEVLLELYMREMPLKGCYAHGTVPYSDPNNDSFICGAWLRPMDNFFCQKTPLSLYMQPHLT